jgi:hypothetical protein
MENCCNCKLFGPSQDLLNQKHKGVILQCAIQHALPSNSNTVNLRPTGAEERTTLVISD